MNTHAKIKRKKNTVRFTASKKRKNLQNDLSKSLCFSLKIKISYGKESASKHFKFCATLYL